MLITRWLIRLAKAAGILLIAVLVLILATVAVSNTRWFREKIRTTAENQAGRFLNGTLSLGAIEGNLLTGSVLKNVRLFQDGKEVVAVDEVRLSYKSWELVRNDLLFRDLTLTRPRVRLIHDGTGWRIAQLLRLPERRQGGGRALRMPGMTVRQGTITIERADNTGAIRWPARVTGFDGELSLTVAAGVTDLDIDRAVFQAAGAGAGGLVAVGPLDHQPGPPLRPGPAPAHQPQRRGRIVLVPAGRAARGAGVDGLELLALPLRLRGVLGPHPRSGAAAARGVGRGQRLGPDGPAARGHDAVGSRPPATSARTCSSTTPARRARSAASCSPSGWTWRGRSRIGSWPAGSPPTPTSMWR